MKPFLLALCILLTSFFAYSQAKKIRIQLPVNASNISRKAAAILSRQISERCPAKIVTHGNADITIRLVRTNIHSPEAFTISQDVKAGYIIAGSDENGILYGVGKFLHASKYDSTGFTPGTWLGTSAPVGKVRGIYLATHFRNFYEAASIEEVERYIEDLALWGVNSLVIHFANWQYTGFDDPEAQASLKRCMQIFSVAHNCGMKVGLLQVPNQAFKTVNPAFLNVSVPDSLGRRGHFGVNLDPANLAANKYLKENWSLLLDQFKGIGLDLMAYWPYDEGGCGCDQCWPWGANGFPKLSQELTEITRKKYPGIKTVLSTWMYDTPPTDEWEGLTNYVGKNPGSFDYIMADSHEDFPRYPLDKGVPANLPLLNFPEISMWGQNPWGGYGANPLPARLQRLWDQTDGKLRGGFPYSEGIYEDMNKVICAQLYWDPKKAASETVKEYIAYEFGPEVVPELQAALVILESNHLREEIKTSASEAFRVFREAEKKLTPQSKGSWRWRILYLRALIDNELYLRNGKLEGEVLKAAFKELTSIYYAEHAHSMPIHPPVIE